MAERSFKKEIEQLRLGDGQLFQGEGILAVTKALLQSGVSYVGGYQGAPVSHLVDVLVDAEDLMAELGVRVETCANEAAAAAMLGASVNYPLRGAVTWKAIVGTNVAADGLSNLSSPGVKGGVLIIVGADYGEGASVIQERSIAFAMKSTIWLLDPRPNLEKIVEIVELGFQLSEASSAPVMMELRIRACHLQGQFKTKNNVEPLINTRKPLAEPAAFDYGRLAHPPVSFTHEKHKITDRLPAAQRFIVEHHMNEVVAGDMDEVGIILQGGLYNNLLRRLQVLKLADVFGNSRMPLLILNVTHPLVPSQINDFCVGKKAVMIMEEGNPEFLEYQINTLLRQADIQTKIYGKDILPPAGEYTAEVIQEGLVRFLAAMRPRGYQLDERIKTKSIPVIKAEAVQSLGKQLPGRPPQFCTGCPERPVFSAIKLLEQELGKVHIAADIGCHALATFEPFSMGNSILGYGMSLASAAAVAPFQQRRSISIMGDGGFWHNGLNSGVIGTLLNRGDAVLIIMENGYSAATGQQYIPNSDVGRDGKPLNMNIESTLRALGVTWLRRVRTYSITVMADTLREALTTPEQGLKIIIADGECQLVRQRRVRQEVRIKIDRGERNVTEKFGIDDAICTGDHSCIRLSGCPSLTVKPNPDPLRTDPVASIISSCVGCGLCGEVAHAATLCPSFYRVERVQNPGALEKTIARMRRRIIGWFQHEVA